MLIHCYSLFKKAFLPLSSCHYQWKTCHGLNETSLWKEYMCLPKTSGSLSLLHSVLWSCLDPFVGDNHSPSFIWGPTQTSLPPSSRLFKLAYVGIVDGLRLRICDCQVLYRSLKDRGICHITIGLTCLASSSSFLLFNQSNWYRRL